MYQDIMAIKQRMDYSCCDSVVKNIDTKFSRSSDRGEGSLCDVMGALGARVVFHLSENIARTILSNNVSRRS